jgi:hypothetical protein
MKSTPEKKMLQADYSNSVNIPPSLPAEALDEFAELTHAFLRKYLEEYEIPSVEVIVQWNPKQDTDTIAQPKVMLQVGCFARTGRNRCPGTSFFWGRKS